jgi:hypothetical protein
MLGYYVTIGYNARDVWWGYLDAIDVYLGDIAVSVSLAGMWNSIAVEYTSGTESLTTSAATHASSVAAYGTKEIVVPASDIDTATAAELLRDRLVEFYGLPRLERVPQTLTQDVYAVLTLAGLWNTLNWRYYQDTGTSDVVTTTQIADIVTASGQFIAATDIMTASGVSTLETRDGTQRAGDEIVKLLEIGVSGGNRLKARVDKYRRLIVEEETSAGEADYHYRNGKITNRWGGLIKPWECPTGEWFVVDSQFLIATGVPSVLADVGRFFVEEANYEVEDNLWQPTPRGSYVPGVQI